MAKIEFKTKKYEMPDGKIMLHVPKLGTHHCDMNEFRKHPEYRGLVNSTLFTACLSRIRKERLGDYIWADKIPSGVSVDMSGYLAVVTLDV